MEDEKEKVGVNQFGVIPTTTVASITTVDESDGKGKVWLRRLAELRYITNEDGISIKQLALLPEFSGKVSEAILSRWSYADDWVQKRSDFFNKIKEQIEERLGSVLVKERSEQLKELKKVSDLALEKIVRGEAKPISLEQMINAYTKLNLGIDELRTKLSKDIIPENLGGGIAQPLKPVLDESEAMELARRLITMRTEKMRSKMEQSETGNTTMGDSENAEGPEVD